ncbi:unnamed protein product [Enterobius vermicularis]|uniref:Uncharacterized protein n=1 Tax=Enterobius vermicularis TaxID=51028 RepID=A0A0N4VMD5_ENTVE|nr:unnamed protein product [Enterobius vermicularis]
MHPFFNDKLYKEKTNGIEIVQFVGIGRKKNKGRGNSADNDDDATNDDDDGEEEVDEGDEGDDDMVVAVDDDDAQSTPVIGGSCDLGSAEVQIGGKQTQFFLKCEPNQESQEGKGVWVVKSRNAASPTAIPQPSTTLPPANTEPQQHPKQLRKQPSIICCPTSS